MWMEHLKKFLGLTLLLTTIWLMDVFSALVDSSVWVMKLNTLLLMTFFAIYLANKITKNRGWITLFAIIPLLFFADMQVSPLQHFNNEGGTALVKDKKAHGLAWESWSEQKMQDHRGSLVFMDFTAKWCMTCKVNEKLVIDTAAFRNLVQKNDVKLLLGDWTKRDPIIGGWLKRMEWLVCRPILFKRKTELSLSLVKQSLLQKFEKALN